jgi:hypothetical protein
MGDSTNVRVGYGGKVYVAPVGTAAPATLSAAWGTGWVDLGYISDDGLTEGSDQDRNEFYAWGADAPVRTQITRNVTTFNMTFIETKGDVLSVYYATPGSAMTSSGSGATQVLTFVQGQQVAPDVRALGIDIVDGARTFRFIIPRCEVSDKGDVNYAKEDLIGYELTFTALLASDGTVMTRMYGQVAVVTP